MDPEEFIRGLVSVGLVVTMSFGASCQGVSGSEISAAGTVPAAVLDNTLREAPAAAPSRPSSRSR
jgi:hypothetical protein